MKLGIWLAIGVLVFIWLKRAQKRRIRERGRAAQASARADETAPGIERMVPCAHCGLHIPASDASVTHGGAVFCSEAHRRLHSRA